MFESSSKILSDYISVDQRQLWRFDIYSIATERGENPEDLYYLCNVRGSWFIIFETDYFDSLEYALEEARELFEPQGFKITHWVAKREGRDNLITVPLEVSSDKSQYGRLVLDVEATYLKCAVLSVEKHGAVPKRYDPNTYGYST